MDQTILTLLIWGWLICALGGYHLIRTWTIFPYDDGYRSKWTNSDWLFFSLLSGLLAPVTFMVGITFWCCTGLRQITGKEWWERECNW